MQIQPNQLSATLTPFARPPAAALTPPSADARAAEELPANSTTDEADSLAVEEESDERKKLRAAFQDFVGQTFFSEMIKAFRSSQEPAAYFHGGRAEEIFEGQFDQVLSEELSESSAKKIADPMFELFMLGRQS